MLHQIRADDLGALGSDMARAVERCVHCGFCLPACPTYRILGEEMDSPRGRIVLMKGVLEGGLAAVEARPYVDRCVGCLACEPACPSGVRYRELLHPYRARDGRGSGGSWPERLRRSLVHATLPHPRRFRLMLALARLARPAASVFQGRWRAMLDLAGAVPQTRDSSRPLPEVWPCAGHRRARVALLAGCVQQVIAPRINWATLRVLARNGVETVVPRAQVCCGSLALHDGEWRRARDLARRNLAAFSDDVDAVVTNAAGCGSGLHEVPALFKGLAEEDAARRLADQVVDVSVFLDRLGLAPPPALPRPLTVVYQDACHLAQAQGVREPPRRLLAAVPGLTLVEIPEADLCCGSAGTYNLDHPEIAAEMGRRKASHLLAAAPDLVATGNVGCLVQMRAHLGERLPVAHTVEILDRAYAGEELPGRLQ